MDRATFEIITGWQRETFTKATAQSAAKHLEEEVGELVHDLTWEMPKERTLMEFADCFMLLFGSASLYGLSYDDIIKTIMKKFEINQTRKWGEVNEKGYVKHV